MTDTCFSLEIRHITAIDCKAILFLLDMIVFLSSGRSTQTKHAALNGSSPLLAVDVESCQYLYSQTTNIKFEARSNPKFDYDIFLSHLIGS